jgi:hypothetical protein
MPQTFPELLQVCRAIMVEIGTRELAAGRLKRHGT